jgi:hypothetical protein
VVFVGWGELEAEVPLEGDEGVVVAEPERRICVCVELEMISVEEDTFAVPITLAPLEIEPSIIPVVLAIVMVDE